MRENDRAGTQKRLRDRFAAGFLLVLMLAGSIGTWVGVPLGCMWLAGELTDSFGTHFLIALPLTVVAVVVSVRGLFWLNRLYLRVTLGPAMGLDDEELEEEERRWMRGPLEPILIASLILAVIALFAWFFFFAENPGRQVI